jgi:hypothetical protein
VGNRKAYLWDKVTGDMKAITADCLNNVDNWNKSLNEFQACFSKCLKLDFNKSEKKIQNKIAYSPFMYKDIKRKGI